MISLGIPLIARDGACFYNKPFEHLVCIGGTGKGKTTFMHRLIDSVDGGIIIIDPTGDLADRIYDDDCIYVDKYNPISLNPLTRGYLSKSEIANEFTEVLEAAVKSTSPDQWGSSILMQKIIRNAVRVGITDATKMSNFFEYEHLRKNHDDKYWKHFDDKDGKGWYVDRERVESAKRLSARLSLLTEDETVRPFVHGYHQFSVKDIADNGKKIIFNLHGFDDFTVSFIGGLIANLVKSYYRNQATPESPPLFFFCDEVHYFLTDKYQRFFVDCRKYNISINISLHSKTQVDKNVVGIIDDSVTTKVMLKPKFKADVTIDDKDYHIGLYPPITSNPRPKVNFLRDNWIKFDII